MIKKHFSSDFIKSVITLVTGTGIAQGIAFLAAPVLSRYYEPEDFTVFALFSATAAILSVVATARYELAIPLPKEDKDAKSLLRLSLLISLIVATITMIGVATYHFFSGSYKSPHFTFWFYLIPLSVLVSGIYNAFNYWSTRIKTFRLNSAGRIAMAIVTSSTSIVFGYLAYDATGLIIGLVAGQIMSMLVLSFPYWKNRKQFFEGINHENVKVQAKIHRSFLRVNSPHALLDSIQDNGVVYFLSYFFIDAVTGWYSFAFRILKAPVGLIGGAFYQVFYQKLSQAKNEGADLRTMVRSMYLRMFMIGFPGFLVLFLFTPELFSFLFGLKWHEAGVIARILIPWLFLNFIVSPVSCITLVCSRQSPALLFTIADSIVRVIALIIGGMRQDYLLSFYIISAFSSSLMIFALWWYYSIAKRYSNFPNGL